jgi:hypothetical protein
MKNGKNNGATKAGAPLISTKPSFSETIANR